MVCARTTRKRMMCNLCANERPGCCARDFCDQVRTTFVGARPASKPKPVTRRTPESAPKPTDQPFLPFQKSQMETVSAACSSSSSSSSSSSLATQPEAHNS